MAHFPRLPVQCALEHLLWLSFCSIWKAKDHPCWFCNRDNSWIPSAVFRPDALSELDAVDRSSQRGNSMDAESSSNRRLCASKLDRTGLRYSRPAHAYCHYLCSRCAVRHHEKLAICAGCYDRLSNPLLDDFHLVFRHPGSETLRGQLTARAARAKLRN